MKNLNRISRYSFALLACLLLLASCDKSIPLQHSKDCKFATPTELAQSLALSLRDEDFTCASKYLPGMAEVFGMQSTNPGDSAVAGFGEKAEHILVKALKEDILRVRGQVAAKGGDITQLKLLKITEAKDQAISKITLHLSAGSLEFTIEPVGLFQSEDSWCILGPKLVTSID